MSSELEADLKGLKDELQNIKNILRNDPDNVEYIELKTELEDLIATTETQIPPPPPSEPTADSQQQPPPKWSVEKHPAFQPGYRRPGTTSAPTEQVQAPIVFKVNDTILAKWSADKAFYPARITSITGSSASPIYTVKFKDYADTSTLTAADLKPIIHDSKKRKADALPVTPLQPIAPGVISSAPNINQDLADQAKKEPSKVSDGPARLPKVPKKVKANKELEAGKSKWQDFSAKSKTGKSAKKDSMFRTGESVNAKVGFTGSGQAMRKDPTRSRHLYETNNNDD